MDKRALITGINGQDAAYLSKLLVEKGYEVYGVDRRRVDSFSWRLNELGIGKEVKYIYMDLLEYNNIYSVIKKVKPTEIYNLAAQSFVAASFEQPILTSEVDAMGVLRILEVIRAVDPSIKFYQASTSEMFGKVRSIPQNEDTMFYPRSPYGVAKLYAHWITKNYRESYDMFACSGILFNHESPLRGHEFVTKKITNHIAQMQNGLDEMLILGNMNAKRDWGYAKEYVEGMWKMLQHNVPDDFVLATGATYSIRKFVEYAFDYVGVKIEWQGKGIDEKGYDSVSGKQLVGISKDFFRPNEVDLLVGDASKAKSILQWEAKTDLKALVGIMMEYDMAKAKETLSRPLL